MQDRAQDFINIGINPFRAWMDARNVSVASVVRDLKPALTGITDTRFLNLTTSGYFERAAIGDKVWDDVSPEFVSTFCIRLGITPDHLLPELIQSNGTLSLPAKVIEGAVLYFREVPQSTFHSIHVSAFLLKQCLKAERFSKVCIGVGFRKNADYLTDAEINYLALNPDVVSWSDENGGLLRGVEGAHTWLQRILVHENDFLSRRCNELTPQLEKTKKLFSDKKTDVHLCAAQIAPMNEHLEWWRAFEVQISKTGFDIAAAHLIKNPAAFYKIRPDGLSNTSVRLSNGSFTTNVVQAFVDSYRDYLKLYKDVTMLTEEVRHSGMELLEFLDWEAHAATKHFLALEATRRFISSEIDLPALRRKVDDQLSLPPMPQGKRPASAPAPKPSNS